MAPNSTESRFVPPRSRWVKHCTPRAALPFISLGTLVKDRYGGRERMQLRLLDLASLANLARAPSTTPAPSLSVNLPAGTAASICPRG